MQVLSRFSFLALSFIFLFLLSKGGTLGRTAGIYRAGVASQYSSPYAPGMGQQGPPPPVPTQAQQQPHMRGRNPPSVGYASATGSLGGPSRRSSSSSGNQRGPGYAPTGAHVAQQAQPPPQQMHQPPMVSLLYFTHCKRGLLDGMGIC